MKINISPNPVKKNIRVGYIDPVIGYVNNVSVSKANTYAKNNPRTKFIFNDGNNTLNYLNINQVNELTGQELLSKNPCEGIQNKEIKSPIIQFSGGGGIGALANPVIGTDGSILAVDLIYGGNGYQYPPIVSVNDFSVTGSGAVLESSLGTIAETILDCNGFEDLEEYDDSDEDRSDFGRVYGQNGNDIGPWDPRNYLLTVEDSISKQIEDYIRLLNDRSRNPFWTTRKRKPDRLFSDNNIFIPSKIYEDSDSRWNEFLSAYGISPIPRSNVNGSDYTGIIFTMEWDEDFPYDGEYIFRGLADNFGTLYIDDVRVAGLAGLAGPVAVIQKTITKGVHTIKLEALNGPILESEVGIINSTVGRFVNVTFYVTGEGDQPNQYGFKFTSEDGSHSFTIVRPNTDGVTNSVVIPVKQKTNYKVQQFSTNRALVEIGTLIDGTEGSGGRSSDSIFADGIGTENDNNDIQLRADIGSFTPVRIQDIRGRTNFSITYRVEEGRVGNNSVDNPLAIALSIDAPPPPVPKLPPVVQDGPCPPNPFWTTRFQNSEKLWYPAISEKFWEIFMNRYAISPVPPLSTGDSGAGKVFRNSWTIDAPYSGTYGFRGTADYIGKFFVDDVEIARLQPATVEKPETVKFTLSKGPHKITIEVQNEPLTVSIPVSGNIIDVNFNVVGDSRALFTHNFKINQLGIDVFKPSKTPLNIIVKGECEIGKVYEVEFFVNGEPGGSSSSVFSLKIVNNGLRIVMEDGGGDIPDDMVVNISTGKFFNIRGNKCSFVVDGFNPVPPPPQTPTLWGENPIGVSAIIIAPCCPKNVGGRGVVNNVTVRVPGTGYPIPPTITTRIGIETVPGTGPGIGIETAESGIGIETLPGTGPGIETVPGTGPGTGPGIGIETVPGTVPGTGPGIGIETVPTYPVLLTLEKVDISEPGIGYPPPGGPCVGTISITPDNGAVLTYETDSFGRITNVIIVNPGFGFTTYPTITVSSECGGVNAEFIPVFRIIRDPILPPEDETKLIQVTDLVGLKQTGYINGRPYYGSVFFQNNVKYAGVYKTVGDLVQVYDTLKESIDAQVTTLPSAIQRQGTDITSNDPRLNIPGTPQNLI